MTVSNKMEELDEMHWDYHTSMPVPAQAKFYKVTTQEGVGTEGITYRGDSSFACTELPEKVFDGKSPHAYTHPVVAAFLQYAFDGYDNPVVWEAEMRATTAVIEGVVAGVYIRPRRRMGVKLSVQNCMRAGFGCVQKVYKEDQYNAWVIDWWGHKPTEFKPEEIVKITHTQAKDRIKLALSTDRHKVCAPAAFAAYAANYMAQAVCSIERKAEDSMVRFLIAQAALYAVYAADQMNEPFDLVSILESAFTPGKEG